MTIKVFISYSHEDKDSISPIVDLLRVMMKNSVFQDYRNIEPGKKWREQLFTALDKSKTVLVFWCEHSSNSVFVKEEYEKAINSKKDVMPLLLDDTALPESLKEYQWIDFRGLQFHRPPPVPTQTKHPTRLHYPTDEWGNYVDWEGEEYSRKLKSHFARLEKDLTEAARIITSELERKYSL